MGVHLSPWKGEDRCIFFSLEHFVNCVKFQVKNAVQGSFFCPCCRSSKGPLPSCFLASGVGEFILKRWGRARSERASNCSNDPWGSRPDRQRQTENNNNALRRRRRPSVSVSRRGRGRQAARSSRGRDNSAINLGGGQRRLFHMRRSHAGLRCRRNRSY